MFTDAITLYIHQYITAIKDGVKHYFKRHYTYV
jgi:hypothetical protein